MDEQRKVGPYQLRAQLGGGGMGLVWEAWDERLDRRVAIKQIRPDRSDDLRLRQKFQREARATAQLSHPAIVQVFDLVEAEDSDWLVMEHVSGHSLAEELREGPLGLERLLALAQEIAEGLVEAHAKGFLHRDLKTENVLLSINGHAKILDFGLAKPYAFGADDGLTQSGEIVGTCRAMSPEQVTGGPLDPRSDLFSFGVLLYEMATGVSPFHGQTPGKTLLLVCQHQQPPAHELNPALPEELSQLIDHLLEKDRERRPASARVVAERISVLRGHSLATASLLRPSSSALIQETLTGEPTPLPSTLAGQLPRRSWPLWLGTGLAVLALLGAGGLLWQRLAHREPLVVAVAEPQLGVPGPGDNAQLAATAVRSALLRALTFLEGVVPTAAGAETLGNGSPEEVARTLAADEVVSARLDCPTEACRLTLERRRMSDQQVLWVEVLEVPSDDFPLLATAVAAAVERGFPGFEKRRGAPELSVRQEDFARYLAIEQAYWTRPERSDLDQLIDELAAIRDSSPEFLEAYLLGAELLSSRHYQSRDAADLERAFLLLHTAQALAPGDPRVSDIRFSVALPGGRLAEAETALAELERLAPGSTEVLMRRAVLVEQLGDGQRALDLMRSAVRRRPSLRNLFSLANLEVRQGQIDAARATLESLRQSFPHDRRGLSLLAQLELLSGDPARAAQLYGELVTGSSSFIDLTNLGTAQLLLARYGEAVESFRAAMQLAPNNPGVVLNAADAEWLLGREDNARELYRRVLAQVAADPTAETNWQSQSSRAQALAHLDLRPEAVAAAQKAQQLSPNNPQVAYEAALVYALVGDEESALASATKAIEGGVEARWFEFPWFDALRRRPELARLLPAEKTGS